MNKTILIVAIIIVIIGGVILLFRSPKTATAPVPEQTTTTTNPATSTPETTPTQSAATPTLTPPATSNPPTPAATVGLPLSKASERITKKFFGTYVTPKNSPVQPERFTGYHTGLDFETFPEEQNTDVAIKAICNGPILKKGRATGYGGYAVQSCTIENQAVTVVYGHLRESSITPSVGSQLATGDVLAVLGTGYSSETDGERKHLHLSIHKGTSANIKGYVQTKAELSGWLDPQAVLGL